MDTNNRKLCKIKNNKKTTEKYHFLTGTLHKLVINEPNQYILRGPAEHNIH